MLKDQRSRNPIGRQPTNRLPDQITRGIGEILTHSHVEGPRRETLAANVVRKVNEIRVVAVNGIAAYVGVKKHGAAEQEVAKDQRADEQETQSSEQSRQA